MTHVLGCRSDLPLKELVYLHHPRGKIPRRIKRPGEKVNRISRRINMIRIEFLVVNGFGLGNGISLDASALSVEANSEIEESGTLTDRSVRLVFADLNSGELVSAGKERLDETKRTLIHWTSALLLTSA